MAKYSRSAQSMAESIGELSAQRAEEFLNTFYFEYGHRSIAGLAHLVLGGEDLSILAAIRLVDEPLWDGQERSTRYQDFKKSGYFVPPDLSVDEESAFREAADRLFAVYESLSAELTDLLVAHHPRPDAMTPAQFRRTLRARAFDVARYCLPLATRTSVGQVVSARVLEGQISRLMADPYSEVRALADALRRACEEPAFSPAWEKLRAALAEVEPEALSKAARAALDLARSLLEPPRAAPTLVKYTAPSPYWSRVMADFRAALAEYGPRLGSPDRAREVELAEPESPEDEVLASCFYAVAEGHSYRQLQALVASLSAGERGELLRETFAARGPHDELPRTHRAGYAVKLDLLTDLGAFRDLHRHRRCVQIPQPLNAGHGAAPGAEMLELGLSEEYGRIARAAGLDQRLDAALAEAGATVNALAQSQPLAAHYLLPLGYRTRCLFKMDLAEAAYISELRSAEGGH